MSADVMLAAASDFRDLKTSLGNTPAVKPPPFDFPPATQAARGLGLDVVSVHDIGRCGLSAYEELTLAAADGRVFVTRNRDDYIHLTREFYKAASPHPGVLLVNRSIPPDRPERVAHALLRWVKDVAERHQGDYPGAYCIDFLGE